MNPIDNLNMFAGRDELVDKLSNTVKKVTMLESDNLDIKLF